MDQSSQNAGEQPNGPAAIVFNSSHPSNQAFGPNTPISGAIPGTDGPAIVLNHLYFTLSEQASAADVPLIATLIDGHIAGNDPAVGSYIVQFNHNAWDIRDAAQTLEKDERVRLVYMQGTETP